MKYSGQTSSGRNRSNSKALQNSARKASRQGKPVLRLANATFRLGDRLVFADTNWTISPGQHWAIVGGNGSGKSLLGDAIRGRLPIVAGDLDYGFRPPPGLTHEECIGHVSFEHRKLQGDHWVLQSRWSATEQEQAL